jgi:hypothetical protein
MLLKSFEVELSDCTFLKGSQITERRIYMGSQGSLGALDFEQNQDRTLELVVIRVKKEIGGIEHEFDSQPLSASIDDLRIRIEFFKSVVVSYDIEKPTEYYFDFK